MEEARRFFRYVVPGLVLIMELFLYLWVSIDLFPTANEYGFYKFIKELLSGGSVAIPLTIFLSSGGIGFLLGSIYHTVSWTIGIRPLVVDHTQLIKDAIKRGWLELENRNDGNSFNGNNLSRSGSWFIVTSFWHERKGSSERIKAANARIDSLTDIMHGLGTVFIGSIVAFIFWIFVYYKFLGKWPCIYYYAIPITMSGVHLRNYCLVVNHFQIVFDIIMANELRAEYLRDEAPIVLNVASKDLIKKRNKG